VVVVVVHISVQLSRTSERLKVRLREEAFVNLHFSSFHFLTRAA
jgi:hypothetical protein